MSSSVLVECSDGPASLVLPLDGTLESSNWALPVLLACLAWFAMLSLIILYDDFLNTMYRSAKRS